MTTPDWNIKAACRNAPVAVFITSGDDDDEPFYPTAAALSFCNVCKVKVECLEWATTHHEVGTWGGTTRYQRDQLDRELNRAKCPGCGSADLIYENTIELCLSCGMSWNYIT